MILSNSFLKPSLSRTSPLLQLASSGLGSGIGGGRLARRSRTSKPELEMRRGEPSNMTIPTLHAPKCEETLILAKLH